MKTRTLFVVGFLTLLNTNCTSQQNTEGNPNTTVSSTQQPRIEKIELKEQTRGTRRITTLTPTSRIFSLNDNITTLPWSSNEWKKIIDQANQVDLSSISNLKAPTSERASDGALAASIFITANGKVYVSSSFDAGAPPKELDKLYKMITAGGMSKKQ